MIHASVCWRDEIPARHRLRPVGRSAERKAERKADEEYLAMIDQ